MFKYFSIILLLLIASQCKAQFDTILFSQTGNTVLFSYRGGSFPGSDTSTWHMKILTSEEKGVAPKEFSDFDIHCIKNEKWTSRISKDTLKKYDLRVYGFRNKANEKEVYATINITDLKQVGFNEYYNDSIYSCKARVRIMYKENLLREQSFNYMFQGSPEKLDSTEICSIIYWKKQNENNYFISLFLTDTSYISTDGRHSEKTTRPDFLFYERR